MTRRPAKRNKTQQRSVRKPAELSPLEQLLPAQRIFALAYLENGFNATQAYLKAYPKSTKLAAQVSAHHALRSPKVRVFLNTRLEEAWKPLQMGGEQALARVGILAADAEDDRVKLAALRTILEQSGKLKSIPDSIDALAAALRADLDAHKDA